LSRPLKVQIVERARGLIANEGVCPMSDTAMKRCGLGALIAAGYEITGDDRAAHDLAIRAMQPVYGTATLVKVNDLRGHAAVLALFDEVIAAG
jgi:hypothetical protein